MSYDFTEAGLNTLLRGESRCHAYPRLRVLIETWPYRRIAELNDRVAWVEFAVYTADFQDDGSVLYQGSDENGPQLVEDFAKAMPLVFGTVRQDGCCDRRYPQELEYWVYTCGLADMEREALIWGAVYDEAAKWMPHAVDLGSR